jgi:hypothetical protein
MPQAVKPQRRQGVSLYLRDGPVQVGDDDLSHAIHRLGGRRGAGPIGIADQLEEPVRDDLPAQAEAVFAPAALRFLAAAGQPLPVVVDFLLISAVDGERHRFGELEARAAVDADEPGAIQDEAAG